MCGLVYFSSPVTIKVYFWTALLVSQSVIYCPLSRGYFGCWDALQWQLPVQIGSHCRNVKILVNYRPSARQKTVAVVKRQRLVEIRLQLNHIQVTNQGFQMIAQISPDSRIGDAVMLIVNSQVGISDASGQLLLWQVSSTTTSSEPFQVRRRFMTVLGAYRSTDQGLEFIVAVDFDEYCSVLASL